MKTEPLPNSAYTTALVGESFDPQDGYYDPDSDCYQSISHGDLERFARIIAYKVAHNLSLGYKMDPYTDPLLYVACEDYPCIIPENMSHDLLQDGDIGQC